MEWMLQVVHDRAELPPTAGSVFQGKGISDQLGDIPLATGVLGWSLVEPSPSLVTISLFQWQ